MAMPMKKQVSVKKHPRPHHKPFAPAKKGKQTRKGGKGTSLMHAAAKTAKADAGVSPKPAVSGQPSPNRADYELARLHGKNTD